MPEYTATTLAIPPGPLQRVTTGGTQQPTTGSFTPPVNQLVRHLASFIGPIAKIVVARLANQYTDLDRLYAEASKQIDNEADRKKFLNTRPPA